MAGPRRRCLARARRPLRVTNPEPRIRFSRTIIKAAAQVGPAQTGLQPAPDKKG